MFKKSQVTVFIIIAIVIIVMFGLGYYAMISRITEKGEEQLLRQQISAEKINPLKDYITSCFSLASADGLELLGKQGGYIYKSQGGIIDDPFESQSGQEYIEYEQTKVHYGIYAPISNVGMIFFAQTPEYPWSTFPKVYNPLNPDEIVYEEKYDGYYGRNKLPPFEKPKEGSIQEQLEAFTTNSTLTCIDWTNFQQQGLGIKTEEPNVSVTFTAADVTFTLNWPIEVTDSGTGAVTDINEFAVVYPVRLRKIYDFAAQIMDNDVGDITYSIAATSLDGLTTSAVIPDIFGMDDLIVIHDEESRIIDKEYQFRFMRKNRAPALYYVDNNTDMEGPVCVDSLVQFVEPDKLNIVDSCDDNSFELQLKAIDPDEDKLEFTFDRQLPYEIKPADIYVRAFRIKITVSDGEYKDWQDVQIPTKEE
ncbi:hypothetical protein JW707_05155 [Candidatus Woesearchaeota archaeon]|nr:hypothetical protein [Candidatus Woesearchaeota archaeon]